MWFQVWKYLHERDVENFIFAYPKFQSMKIPWQMGEAKSIERDPLKPKFIPTIETRYGCQTLFRFSDAAFFNEHLQPCLRVAAVYAFFLLGNGEDATHYVVRFNRATHDICEVEMEKLFSDVFYNRHCYGSLYRVQQQDKETRQPTVDLQHSVDRVHMINQNQVEFIGEDLAAKFRFSYELEKRKRTDSDSEDEFDDFYEISVDNREMEEDLEDSLRFCDEIALIDGTYGFGSGRRAKQSKTCLLYTSPSPRD